MFLTAAPGFVASPQAAAQAPTPSIAISPGYTNIGVGQTLQYTATVVGLPNTVTWEVNGVAGGNSTIGTITTGGLYQAPALVPSVSTLVEALGSDGKTLGVEYVNVESAGPPITAIAPNPIPIGSFTITVTGTGFLPGAGVVVNGAGLSTTYVNSTTLNASGYQGSAVAGVFQAHNPDATLGAAFSAPFGSALTISPTTASVILGQTQQFTSAGANSWTASAGTVSSSGLYKAPAVMPASSAVTVAATGPGGSASAKVTLLPIAQTITFAAIAAQTVGTPLTLTATATSGLAVSFASTTTSICSASGTTATLISAGTCTIQATQVGNTTYAAATPVSSSFTVNAASKTAQTITFGAIATQIVGTPLTLTAAATSGLAVSFASSTTSVCTVSGTMATLISAGTCTIQATQAGNATYAAATPVSSSFTVNAASKTAQTIAFGTIATQTVGASLPLTATATSGLVVSFASTAVPVCTVSGTTATMIAAGICTIQANQAGNGTYTAATPVSQTFIVNAAALSAPTALTYSANPAVYTVNVAIVGNFPSNSGGAIASYAVAPALPAGLSLNTTTGEVTGTPIATAATAAYTVTGTNASGHTSVSLTITVNPVGVEPTCGSMSLGNNASLNGYIPFPSSYAWNVNIASASLDPNNTTITSASGFAGEHLHHDFSSVAGGNYGIPYVVVDSSSTPLVPINVVAYPGQSDVADAPFPPTAPIEGNPAACTGGPNDYIGDQHVLVLDRNRCMLYETFNSVLCSGAWSADQETIWDMQTGEMRPWGWTSADAAGLSVFAGLLRYDEVASGVINHAIRFTLPHTKNDANEGYFVEPATHAAGTDWGVSNVMGMRIRLKASFNISGYSAANQVILTAMKNYGMILADNGSYFFFQGVPDPRWNDDDLSNLDSIQSSNFEVVQMAPEFPGWDSGTAPTGLPPTIGSFTASATSVAAGIPVTLTWETSNDSYDFIDKLGGVHGGSVTITPTATTIYTLTATNQYGPSTAQVTVTVK
jgi:hypothetical protein